MQHNWTSQGTAAAALVFPSVTYAPLSRTYPATTIPMYIGSGGIAVRKPKLTEVNTVLTYDGPTTSGFHASFAGVPDPLTWQLSGFVITPSTPIFGNDGGNNAGAIWNVLQPTNDGTSTGTKLTGLLGTSYSDLICAYTEGRMFIDAQTRPTRIDPTSFIDEQGNVYANPKLTSFQASYTSNPRKQTFNMTLWIEN